MWQNVWNVGIKVDVELRVKKQGNQHALNSSYALTILKRNVHVREQLVGEGLPHSRGYV